MTDITHFLGGNRNDSLQDMHSTLASAEMKWAWESNSQWEVWCGGKPCLPLPLLQTKGSHQFWSSHIHFKKHEQATMVKDPFVHCQERIKKNSITFKRVNKTLGNLILQVYLYKFIHLVIQSTNNEHKNYEHKQRSIQRNMQIASDWVCVCLKDRVRTWCYRK